MKEVEEEVEEVEEGRGEEREGHCIKGYLQVADKGSPFGYVLKTEDRSLV